MKEALSLSAFLSEMYQSECSQHEVNASRRTQWNSAVGQLVQPVKQAVQAVRWKRRHELGSTGATHWLLLQLQSRDFKAGKNGRKWKCSRKSGNAVPEIGHPTSLCSDSWECTSSHLFWASFCSPPFFTSLPPLFTLSLAYLSIFRIAFSLRKCSLSLLLFRLLLADSIVVLFSLLPCLVDSVICEGTRALTTTTTTVVLFVSRHRHHFFICLPLVCLFGCVDVDVLTDHHHHHHHLTLVVCGGGQFIVSVCGQDFGHSFWQCRH